MTRARFVVSTAMVVVLAGLVCAGFQWARRPMPPEPVRVQTPVAVQVPVAVQIQLSVDGAPVALPPEAPRVPVVPRPISDEELTTLILDLRTRPFAASQLGLLRAEAERYRFTPEQGARVLMCFHFDGDKLGALEILRPRLLGTDYAPLLAQFDGPFGEDRNARLILEGR